MAQKNIALNRPVTSSDGYYTGYKPEKAVDGDLSSSTGFLQSYVGAVSLTIELEQIYLVRRMKLKQLNFGGYRCKDFSIEVSTDNKEYKEIYSGTLKDNDELQEFKFNSFYQCKFFKFIIKNSYIASNKSNGIGEVEIYELDYKFLIKQDKDFYTIKDGFYIGGNFVKLNLDGGSQPNLKDYDDYGFKEINSLLSTYETMKVDSKNEDFAQQGKLFSFNIDKYLRKINTITNIVESLYSSPYSSGDRRELIEISANNSMTNDDIKNLIDGDKKTEIWIRYNTRNNWISFIFPEPICIQEISWFHRKLGSNHGSWVMQGSNDGVDYVNVSQSFYFYCEDRIYKFPENQKEFTHYKWKQVSSDVMDSGAQIYEAEFGIRPNKYSFLIKQGQYYYTINEEDKIIKIDSVSPTQEVFEKEGVTPDKIKNFANWESITKDGDITLYMWTDNTETETYTLECETDPYRPYDKLNDEFEIYMKS